MIQRLQKETLLIILLLTIALIPSARIQARTAATNSAATVLNNASPQTAPFLRTELYFGTDRKAVPPVSESEWQCFVERSISRRFPEGLTVFQGDGQFQERSGAIVKEQSFVVVLLYPLAERRSRNQRIEEIRSEYMKEFHQQSVLRVDYPLPMSVSF